MPRPDHDLVQTVLLVSFVAARFVELVRSRLRRRREREPDSPGPTVVEAELIDPSADRVRAMGADVRWRLDQMARTARTESVA